MKRFVMAIALACAISSTAFAGIIHSTDGPTPPPPPGDMGNGGNQGSGNLDDDGNQGSGGIAFLILDLLF